MPSLHLAAEAKLPTYLSDDRPILLVVLAIALVALAFAGLFAKEVLASEQGPQTMRDISRAVQEGAAAYLSRQFRTLAVFAVLVFFLLFVLPGSAEVRIGRSIFFAVGASFSALVGFVGMTLATRANVRVAHAANTTGSTPAMRIAFRSGGTVGMFTVGLGLLGATTVLLVYGKDAPEVLEGFGFGGAVERRHPASRSACAAQASSPTSGVARHRAASATRWARRMARPGDPR
ncbi:MAG: sodium/proton-translocating pyrophosphatase, partial [Mycobacteriales bacterium]